MFKQKQIEQTHLAFTMPAFNAFDDRVDVLAIANTILGGGMSSRLFQKIREDLGLAYSVYSYPSLYRDCGIFEIYAGVNTSSRDKAVKEIINEINRFKKDGITEREFLRSKEQMKSSYIMGKESTASLMLLYGKYLLFTGKEYDFNQRLKALEEIKMSDVNDLIKEYFNVEQMSVATVGPKASPIKL
jgi:predicted Zn-dependent peptidase